MPIDRHLATPASPLLAVCGSLKPADGRNDPSACRELLKLALAPIAGVYPSIETLDLRDARLPAFDGREPWEYNHPALLAARAVVEAASGYVFSVPAYWGGIGAAFKNFVETVCGPGYGGGQGNPFRGKSAAVLVVGSDLRVAQAAASQIGAVLDALSVVLARPPIIVGDPRELADVARAVQELTAAAAAVILALPAALALKSQAKQ